MTCQGHKTHPQRMTIRRRWQRGAAIVLALALTTVVSCLGEPEIDERWSKTEFLNVSPQPGATAPAGQSMDVTVQGRITYRQILTGFLVAEVRYSASVPPTIVQLDPEEHTLEIAQDIDRILANSVTAGRATKAVTGFDHLMQDVDLSFTAMVPDSVGVGGLYLLLYMGDGNEIELPGGRDSLVVTPFVPTDREILHTGFPMEIVP